MAATELSSAFSYASGTISAKLARSERVLLQDVSFSLASGERLAIIGETGSGKTMLALSILGLLPANVRMQRGRILLDGTVLSGERQLQALRGDISVSNTHWYKSCVQTAMPRRRSFPPI